MITNRKKTSESTEPLREAKQAQAAVPAALALAILFGLFPALCMAVPQENPAASFRLPRECPAVLGCWFWMDGELSPNGYEAFLDLVARHSAYNYLTASLRLSEKELTDTLVHDQIKRAVTYAQHYSMGIVMDLDVRLARNAFAALYPDELQKMVCLREIDLSEVADTEIQIVSNTLSDHYTGQSKVPYICLKGQLVRVYGYQRSGNQPILSDTIQDITSSCRVLQSLPEKVALSIPAEKSGSGKKACALVSFTYLTPEVFSPHIMDFQRSLIRQYADISLTGACKDEWGYPPCFDGNPAKNDFWYSVYAGQCYASRNNGRDLLRDFLLMYLGEQGRESTRQAAINHYLEMSRERNGLIEQDFYLAVKEILGKDAFVATHPTWYPYPDSREFKKNGLDWWIARRDWAQTDEITPFCIRTSLSKKWNSPLWYNMYYSSDPADYGYSVWSHALGGGRINYHPPYPGVTVEQRRKILLRGEQMKADCRIRLLNFITRSPLDCPVAVIFGQACAMNWAGPSYEDVGLDCAERFWQAGYPADLIPSTEIGDPALRLSRDGYIQYGPQKYQAVILYHPEFENPDTAQFFQRAANTKTALVRIGPWTRDFNANSFNPDQLLPGQMRAVDDTASAVSLVLGHLKNNNVPSQTPCSDWMTFGNLKTIRPPTKGLCRLIDGTCIFLSGEKQVSGDRIQTVLNMNGHTVSVDAVGVIGLRWSDDGSLEALAAGGLRYLKTGSVEIELSQPTDLALWQDGQGHWQGVLQDHTGPIAETLKSFTTNWLQIVSPPPLCDN
jgi:hypothetical protein